MPIALDANLCQPAFDNEEPDSAGIERLFRKNNLYGIEAPGRIGFLERFQCLLNSSEIPSGPCIGCKFEIACVPGQVRGDLTSSEVCRLAELYNSATCHSKDLLP